VRHIPHLPHHNQKFLVLFFKKETASFLIQYKESAMYDGPSAETMSEDQLSLPAWIYHDAEFMHAERERVFSPVLATRVPP